MRYLDGTYGKRYTSIIVILARVSEGLATDSTRINTFLIYWDTDVKLLSLYLFLALPFAIQLVLETEPEQLLPQQSTKLCSP